MKGKTLRAIRAERAARADDRAMATEKRAFVAELERRINTMVQPPPRVTRARIAEVTRQINAMLPPSMRPDPARPDPAPELADWFKKIKTAGGIMLTFIAERGPRKTYALINGRRVPKTIAERLINRGSLVPQRDSLLPDGQPQTWVPRND